MAKNFSATTRALNQDQLIKPLVFLAVTIGLAVMWLCWFCNPALPVYQISRQVYFDGKPGYDTEVLLKDGAYHNRPIKVWTVGAAFSPEERKLIERGQPAVIRPSGPAVAGAGVLRGVVAEAPSWRDALVRVSIVTAADRTLSPAEIGEVRIKTGMRAPLDYVLSGSGLGGSGPGGSAPGASGDRQTPDRP